jgi:hypothetical protein
MTNIQQVTDQVNEGAITGICLDTSIFEKYQLNLRHGCLQRVKQFAYTQIVVYLPTVIKNEVRRHLIEKRREARSGLNKPLKEVNMHWHLRDSQDLAFQALFGDQTPESSADRDLNEWISLVNAKETDIGAVSPNDVFDLYFQDRPPFANKEVKKNEFPDAFTLRSLELIAAQKSTKILVVSQDKGWEDFCSTSDHLVHIDNLVAALGCFQDQSAFHTRMLIENAIRDGQFPQWLNQIKREIEGQLWKAELDVRDDSRYRVENEVLEIKLKSIKFHGIEQEGRFLSAVEFRENNLFVDAEFDIELEVRFVLHFFIFDAIDRDEFCLGSREYKETTNELVEALVGFDLGDFQHQLRPDTFVASVEISTFYPFIDVADAEPDFGGDEVY